jgi:hypothetical protein
MDSSYRRIGPQIVAGVIGALLTALLLAVLPNTFRWLVRPAVPTGAVVAFEGGCPDGWHPFPLAGGRFIVGAGDHPNRPLNTYKVGEIGGEELHQLKIEELPPHSHAYTATGVSTAGCGLQGCNDSITQTSTQTSVVGGGQSFENRPPYLALTYCRR